MGTILNLLKLQIDNKTDILKAASPKKMIVSLLKVILLLALLIFGVSFAISSIKILINFQINAAFLALVLLVVQGVSLVFAVGHIINTLYLSKDNEMLICLPVTPNQLFVSKILLIYLKELAVNAMISIPLFITFGMYSDQLGASFYASIPLLLLLLPIFPIVLASFLSIPVMMIIRFLKKHVVLSIIVILGLVATILWGYISLIGNVASNMDIADKQIEVTFKVNTFIAELGKNLVVYFQLASAMASFSQWYWYPLFLLLCAGLSALTILILRPLYFKMSMSSLEKTVRTTKKVKKFKKSSTLMTLIKKETACIFRSPTDIFEYFLFTLLMPFIVYSYDKLLMSITVKQSGVNMIAGSHVMVLAILAMLSNIVSASAISRDGGNFYTSKIIPVDYYTQIFAKLIFNAIFTIGSLIVTGIVSICFADYPLWQIGLGTLAVAIASIGHIAWSIDMDIKNPTINVQGDEQSSITSKSTPKSLLWGCLIGFILGIIVILMSEVKNILLPYLIIIGLATVFTLNRVYTLVLRINLNYDKIEM